VLRRTRERGGVSIGRCCSLPVARSDDRPERNDGGFYTWKLGERVDWRGRGGTESVL
jgi:hypothetical protein